jgi:hypothetical protein
MAAVTGEEAEEGGAAIEYTYIIYFIFFNTYLDLDFQ